jgi:hypothetical protein
MRANFGKPAGVTFVQLRPPSRVRCATPSSEPVQMIPVSSGEGATVKMVP